MEPMTSITFQLQCPSCSAFLSATAAPAGRTAPVYDEDRSAEAVLRRHYALRHPAMLGEPNAPAEEASEPAFANAGGQAAHLYYAAARMFGWTVQQVNATDEHVLRALLRLAHLRDDDDDGTSGQPAVPPDPDDSGPTITVHVHGDPVTERQLIDAIDERFLHHMGYDRQNPWGRRNGR